MAVTHPVCRVFRCSRQAELYLYLRQDLEPEVLPEALRQRLGQLAVVMTLTLSPERALARVDAARVRAAMAEPGYFVQLPPQGQIDAHLHQGD